MKKIFFTVIILCFIQIGLAQDGLMTIAKGTWVIESTVRDPKKQIVKFYNHKLELIRQELVNDKRIRYHRRSVREKLNRLLAIALKEAEILTPDAVSMALRGH